MILAIRHRASIVVSAILLVAGLAMGAHAAEEATKAVTLAEVDAMLYARLIPAAMAIIGAFWTLILALMRPMNAGLTRLEASVEKLVLALEKHNDDPYAHSAASEHNHSPMLETLKAVSEKLDKLHEEHAKMKPYCPQMGD